MSNFVEIKVSEIVCKLDSIYWAGPVWSRIVLVRNIGGYWGARGSFRGNARGSIQFLSGGGRGLKIHMYPYSRSGDNYLFIFFKVWKCFLSFLNLYSNYIS